MSCLSLSELSDLDQIRVMRDYIDKTMAWIDNLSPAVAADSLPLPSPGLATAGDSSLEQPA